MACWTVRGFARGSGPKAEPSLKGLLGLVGMPAGQPALGSAIAGTTGTDVEDETGG